MSVFQEKEVSKILQMDTDDMFEEIMKIIPEFSDKYIDFRKLSDMELFNFRIDTEKMFLILKKVFESEEISEEEVGKEKKLELDKLIKSINYIHSNIRSEDLINPKKDFTDSITFTMDFFKNANKQEKENLKMLEESNKKLDEESKQLELGLEINKIQNKVMEMLSKGDINENDIKFLKNTKIFFKNTLVSIDSSIVKIVIEKISDNPNLAKLYYGNKELNVDRSKNNKNFIKELNVFNIINLDNCLDLIIKKFASDEKINLNPE